MGLKPTLPKQESLPIDDLIGTAYDVVKLVADNLDAIKLVAANIAQANIGIIEDLEGLQNQFDDLRGELTGNLSTAEATLSQLVNNYSALTTGDYTALNTSVAGVITDLADIIARFNPIENIVISSETRVTQLETDRVGLVNGQSTQGSALEALDTRVVIAEGEIVTSSTKITELEAELDGEVTSRASAINALNATVVIAQNDIIASAADIAVLATQISDDVAGLAAQSIAVSSLTSRTAYIEGEIVTIAQDVVALDSALVNNNSAVSAASSAVATLSTEVGTLEGLVYSHSQDIVDLEAAVVSLDTDTTFSANAIATLTVAVNSNTTGIDVLAEDIVDLNAAIDGLDVNGSAQALTTLAARVTTNEGDIVSQASKTTNLRAAVNQAVVLEFDNTTVYALGDMFFTQSVDPTPIFTYYNVVLEQVLDPGVTFNVAPPNATYYSVEVGFVPMQATIEEHSGVLVDLEQQTARWEVKTNVNDLTSKIGFYNDGTNLNFVIGQGNTENFNYDLTNSKLTITGGITLSEPSTGFGQFTDVPAYALAADITNFVTTTLLDTELAAIQGQLDGNVTSWFDTGVPTLANLPASDWTTDTLKDDHLGDLYYDENTQYAYRFKKVGAVYSWEQLSDSAISAALIAASNAQDTADGKRRVFVVQPIPPYDVGDLWAENGVIRKATLAVPRSGVTLYTAGDWEIVANNITDVSELNDSTSLLVGTAPAWGALEDIPPRFLETSDIGLNLTATHLGYNTDGTPSGWKTYMDNAGNFYLNDGSPTNSLSWNGTNLLIRGSLTLASGSTGYDNLADIPTTLAEINTAEGSRLASVAIGATEGAPAGTLVNGVLAETLTADLAGLLTDFNDGNNRNQAAIWVPSILTGGTAIDHTVQDNGTVDLSFEWVWTANNADIDGFVVYVRSSSSSSPYTFGTNPEQEVTYNVPSFKRAFLLYGVMPTDYYTFGIQAYRIVDTDVNSNGIILTPVVQALGAGENPYRPLNQVAFAGNITGTVNNIPVAEINDWNYINTPNFLNAPSGSGLFANGTHLGYYSAGAWNTYMDNLGNFYLGGTSGKLQWDGSDLTIEGNITMTNQSELFIQGFGGSIDYANSPLLTNTPNNLGDINSTEGSKLGGIQANATFGGTWGTVAAGGNIAGQPADSELLNNRAENGITTVPRPIGGAMSLVASNVTGAIVITLPQNYNNTMLRFIVDVYLYTPDASFTLAVGGYTRATQQDWNNTFVNLSGSVESDNRVRFGDNGAGRCCVVIGEGSSPWVHPKVLVKDFQAGHTGSNLLNWEDDWSVSFANDTELAGYNLPVSYGNAILDARRVDGQGDLALLDAVDWLTQVGGLDRPANNATEGAPAGTFIDGVLAENIATAYTDFNSSNNRNNDPIASPIVATNGTAVDHTIQANGTVDISFEWNWTGDIATIDGFLVYMRASSSGAVYVFGTSPAQETVYTLPASKGALFVYGVTATDYYTFGVQAYRKVDGDVNPAGVVVSPIVKASGSGENPYRPSTSVQFLGNLLGTVNNLPVSQINDWGYIGGTGRPANYATADDPAQNSMAGSSVNFNPNFTLVGADGRPAGFRVTISSTIDNDVLYYDVERTIARLHSASDTLIGAGFPAFKVAEGTTYTIFIRYRSDVATSTGFYFRLYETFSDLAQGKTHIGTNGTSYVQNSTSIVTLHSDVAIGTGWTESTLLYTPSANVKWVSATFLNWAGMENNSLYIDCCYVTSNATEGADWNIATSLKNVPGFLNTPSGTGLFANGTRIGYYVGGAPRSYIDSSGNFFLNNATGDPNNYLEWNGSTLTVRGDIDASSITTAIAKIGLNAGLTNQSAESLAVGNYSGELNQGSNSLAFGVYAGRNNQGNFSVAIGYSAAVGDQGVSSVAIGINAGNSIQGSSCVAIGANSGSNGQDANSIAIGSSAGNANQAVNSVAIGRSAGRSLQGGNSISIGTEAGETSQGVGSTAIGYQSGRLNQASSCVAVGYEAGEDTQEQYATAIGWRAGQTTQGDSSVAIGYYAASTNQGSSSVALGTYAGRTNQGTFAIAIGYSAGAGTSTTNSQGDQAIAIGAYSNAGSTAGTAIGHFTTAVGNSTAVGAGAYAITNGAAFGAGASCSSPNQMTLGGTLITNLRCNDTSISSLSDERDKIVDRVCPVGLDYINELNPVEFTWKYREEHYIDGVPPTKEGTKQIGFIAQELKAAQIAHSADSLNTYQEYSIEESGLGIEILEADIGKLIPVLVKAVQELSAEVDSLKARIVVLEGTN